MTKKVIYIFVYDIKRHIFALVRNNGTNVPKKRTLVNT